MADRYLLESGSPDGYLLEDGSGVLLLEGTPAVKAIAGFQALSHGVVKWPGLHAITHGAIQYPALAPASGGIVVDAAEFDGSTYLSRASFLSDSSTFCIVGFIRKTNSGTTERIFCVTNQALVYVNSSGHIVGEFNDSTFTSTMIVESSVAVDDDSWHSFCLSVSTNFSSGNKLYSLAIDRTVDTPTVTDSSAAFTIDLTAFLDVTAAAGVFGASPWVGCLAELSLDLQYIDFSNSANVDLFVTAANKPENIGTDGSTAYGAACAMYQHLDDAEAPDNFKLNAGTGGNFTVTGTLTTCGTSPSD